MDGKAENLDNLTSELRDHTKSQLAKTLQAKFIAHDFDLIVSLDIGFKIHDDAVIFTAEQIGTPSYSCFMKHAVLSSDDYAEICDKLYKSWVVAAFRREDMQTINDRRLKYGHWNGLKITSGPKGRFFIHYEQQVWYLPPDAIIRFIEDRFELFYKKPVCVDCGTEVSSTCFRCAQHN